MDIVCHRLPRKRTSATHLQLLCRRQTGRSHATKLNFARPADTLSCHPMAPAEDKPALELQIFQPHSPDENLGQFAAYDHPLLRITICPPQPRHQHKGLQLTLARHKPSCQFESATSSMGDAATTQRNTNQHVTHGNKSPMAEPRRCPLDALELTRDDGTRCPRKNVHMVTQETLWRISPRFSLKLAEKPSKSFSKIGRTAG